MKRQILLVTKNSASITQLNKPEWNIVLVQPGEPAIEEVQRQAFDLILLDNNMDTSTFRKMKAVLPLLMEETDINEIGSLDMNTLETVVAQAFEERQRNRMKQLTIMDL